MKFKGYGKSVVGSRASNQDAFLVYEEKNLFAVADGVGGGLKGDVAAKMAVDGLLEVPEERGRLKETVLKIQDRVLQEALSAFGEAVMGTTLTCIQLFEGEADLCHIGDSRAYLYSQGQLRLLTQDHEIYDDAQQVPLLASYLGMPSEVMPLKIQEELIPLSSGQRLLLCSDGLYKQLSNERIVAFIEQYFSFPEMLLEKLCEEAQKEDFSDNITVIFIEIS